MQITLNVVSRFGIIWHDLSTAVKTCDCFYVSWSNLITRLLGIILRAVNFSPPQKGKNPTMTIQLSSQDRTQIINIDLIGYSFYADEIYGHVICQRTWTTCWLSQSLCHVSLNDVSGSVTVFWWSNDFPVTERTDAGFLTHKHFCLVLRIMPPSSDFL